MTDAWTGLSATQHALLDHDGLPGVGAGGGGGDPAQKLYITVGTPGLAAFAGAGATPAGLLAGADFTTNGTDDHLAIQAAINAASPANDGGAGTVLLLPGIYSIKAPLDTKSASIRGYDRRLTLLYAMTLLGAPANMRVFTSTGVGGVVNIENLTVQALTGGAAVIKCANLHMADCDIFSESKGADAGIIDVGAIFTANSNWGQFRGNNCAKQSGPYNEPVLSVSDPITQMMLVENNNFTGQVKFGGTGSINDVIIRQNNFNQADLVLTGQLAKWWIEGNDFQSSSILATLSGGSAYYWNIERNKFYNGRIDLDALIVSHIRGNILNATLLGTAIRVANGGENTIEGNTVDGAANHGIALVTANDCMVIGNRVRGYGNAAANQYDGINVTTSGGCTIQANNCSSSSGRYGLNVVSGTDNFVTNNKLNGGGLTGALNDGGTGTTITAGNKLT